VAGRNFTYPSVAPLKEGLAMVTGYHPLKRKRANECRVVSHAAVYPKLPELYTPHPTPYTLHPTPLFET